MEAAALFTVARPARASSAGCLLTVSDIVVEGVFTRITDEELRAAVDRMTKLALDVATVELTVHQRRRLPRQPGERERRDRQALAGAAHRAASSGCGRDAALRAAGPPDRAGPRSGERRRRAARRRRRRRDAERGRERRRRHRRRARDAPDRHRPDFGRTHGIPTRFDDAVRVALDGRSAHDRRRPRPLPHVGRRRGERCFANVGSVGMSGAVARRANSMSKALGGRATFFYALVAGVPRVEEHRGDGHARRRRAARPHARRDRRERRLARRRDEARAGRASPTTASSTSS